MKYVRQAQACTGMHSTCNQTTAPLPVANLALPVFYDSIHAAHLHISTQPLHDMQHCSAPVTSPSEAKKICFQHQTLHHPTSSLHASKDEPLVTRFCTLPHGREKEGASPPPCPPDPPKKQEGLFRGGQNPQAASVSEAHATWHRPHTAHGRRHAWCAHGRLLLHAAHAHLLHRRLLLHLDVLRVRVHPRMLGPRLRHASHGLGSDHASIHPAVSAACTNGPHITTPTAH
mmetsp:Transcript_27245/g.70147  ORF Transcript_27245/g.70147 Transcript_27245/m.70147 type:complete len:230 (-) Transcript_27245:4965-5654(-)